MATVYPAKIDNPISLPDVIDNVSGINAASVNTVKAAAIAIETALGTLPQGVYQTVRQRLDTIEALIQAAIVGDFIPSGDLSGTAVHQTVIGLQTNPIASGVLGPNQDGYVLTWVNSAVHWAAKPSAISFVAGGDLSGSATNQTVIGIQTNPVKSQSLGATQDGYVLTWRNVDGEWEALPVGAAGSVTLSGDVNGASNANHVDTLTGPGTGTVSIAATNLKWLSSVATPTITQFTPTSDVATHNITITAQAPFASALTNQASGNIIAHLPTPTVSSNDGYYGQLQVQGGNPDGYIVARIEAHHGKIMAGGGNTDTFASIGPLVGFEATDSALWLLQNGATRTSSNYALEANASSIWLQAPTTNINFLIGGSEYAQLTATALGIGSVASSAPVQINYSTPTTPYIQSSTSATQLSVGTNKSGAVVNVAAGTNIVGWQFSSPLSTSTELQFNSPALSNCGNIIANDNGALTISASVNQILFNTSSGITYTTYSTTSHVFQDNGGVPYAYIGNGGIQIQAGAGSTSFVQWVAAAQAPLINQLAATSDVVPKNMTLQPQGPFSGASTNLNGGDVIVNTPASVGVGQKLGGLKYAYNGTPLVNIGSYSSTTYGSIWFAGNAAAPTGTNWGFLGSVSDTYLNAGGAAGNLYFGIGATYVLSVTGSGSEFNLGSSTSAASQIVFDINNNSSCAMHFTNNLITSANIKFDAKAIDAATQNLVITAQAPWSSALTNQSVGNIQVNFPTPTVSSNDGYYGQFQVHGGNPDGYIVAFIEAHHGKTTAGGGNGDFKTVIGPLVNNESTNAAVYFLASGTAPNASNWALEGDGINTYVGAPSGNIYFYVGGAQVAYFTTSTFELVSPSLIQFAATVSNPTINQAQATSAGTGQTLTLISQAAKTGSGSAGGNLVLTTGAGDGGGAPGVVQIAADKANIATTIGYNGGVNAATTILAGNPIVIESFQGGGVFELYTTAFEIDWNGNLGSFVVWDLNNLAFHNTATTPKLWQYATVSDVATVNLTIQPQGTWPSATVHQTVGNVVVNFPAPNTPTTDGYYGQFQIQGGPQDGYIVAKIESHHGKITAGGGGLDYLSIIGPVPTAESVGSALWMLSNGSTASTSNYAAQSDNTNLYLNTVGSSGFFQFRNSNTNTIAKIATSTGTQDGFWLGHAAAFTTSNLVLTSDANTFTYLNAPTGGAIGLINGNASFVAYAPAAGPFMLWNSTISTAYYYFDNSATSKIHFGIAATNATIVYDQSTTGNGNNLTIRSQDGYTTHPATGGNLYLQAGAGNAGSADGYIGFYGGSGSEIIQFGTAAGSSTFGGQIPAGGPAFTLGYATQTSNTATFNLKIQGQYAFASATGANRVPGNLIFDIGAPTNSGTTEAEFQFTRNGSTIGQIGISNASQYSLWLGGAAFTNSNAVIYADAASFTYVNAPTNVGVVIGDATFAAYFSTTSAFFGGATAPVPVSINWSTSTAPIIQSGSNVIQFTIGTSKNAATTLLQADNAVTCISLSGSSSSSAGTGNTSIVGSLQQTTRNTASSFSVDNTTTDNIIRITSSATVTLPAPTLGRTLEIWVDGYAGSDVTLTLAQHSSEKINNIAASFVVTASADPSGTTGQVVKLRVESIDAVNWWVSS